MSAAGQVSDRPLLAGSTSLRFFSLAVVRKTGLKSRSALGEGCPTGASGQKHTFELLLI